MEFAIALVTFWELCGFNTETWRKSLDETQAIVHLPYAEVLVADIRNNPNVQIYECPSVELDTLMQSPEWTEVI